MIQSFYENPQNRDTKITKPKYFHESCKLFINESLYFSGVSQKVWEYKIGGYQVLDKYLKSHKDQNLDIEYFTSVILALEKTLDLESEISKIELR